MLDAAPTYFIYDVMYFLAFYNLGPGGHRNRPFVATLIALLPTYTYIWDHLKGIVYSIGVSMWNGLLVFD
jgi:hypothetical protein